MKVHFEKIVNRPHVTITGTLCNRMTMQDEINSTRNENEVTCKFCLKILEYKKKKERG